MLRALWSSFCVIYNVLDDDEPNLWNVSYTCHPTDGSVFRIQTGLVCHLSLQGHEDQPAISFLYVLYISHLAIPSSIDCYLSRLTTHTPFMPPFRHIPTPASLKYVYKFFRGIFVIVLHLRCTVIPTFPPRFPVTLSSSEAQPTASS
jgi:hypothetical protein